jgi:hypothetical protein
VEAAKPTQLDTNSTLDGSLSASAWLQHSRDHSDVAGESTSIPTLSTAAMYERMRRFAWIFSSLLAVSSARTTLLETAGGRLQVQKIPSSTTTAGLVTIITSPGTPSLLIPEQTSTDDDAVLCLESTEPPCISCRGLTLSANDDGSSLATTCSLLAQALILDGVTVGDVQAGLQQSRHARTLTALFRAKVQLATQTTTTRQLLILGILGGIDNDDVDVPTVEKNVKALYKASAVEVMGAMSFDEAYDLQVVSVQSKEDAKAVRLNRTFTIR